MSRAARSGLAALILLLVLGLLWPAPRTSAAENSFGSMPHGHGALFDLLAELDLPVARSYLRPEELPPEAVIWWIAPRSLCSTETESDGVPVEPVEGEAAEPVEGQAVEPTNAADPPSGWAAHRWLEAGGTAVVFLPGRVVAPGSLPVRCASLGDFPVPARRTPSLDSGPIRLGPHDSAADASEMEESGGAGRRDEAGGEGALDRWWNGTPPRHAGPGVELPLVGPLLTAPRSLGVAGLWSFVPGEARSAGWSVRASLAEADEPFVVERPVGAGRLVLVADASFLANAWLDRADAAPLALDLVRAYGVPRIDEYAHGLRAERRPLVYLSRSAAMPVFVGLALLGGLALWRGTALPTRRLLDEDPAAPTLERFVGSLASLYARSRDHARVAERYRELSLARVRRHFGLPPDTPDRVVLERLERDPRIAPERLALLGPGGASARGAAELRGLVARLDELVKEACR